MLKKKRKIRYKDGRRPNGWTAERRKRQSESIKRWQPWRKSTGPKTAKGKAIVARNAYRHGFRSRDYREICRLLRWQRRFVKNIQMQFGINPYEEQSLLNVL